MDILIIDDSRDTADTLAQMLKLLGHAVTVALGPRPATALLAKQIPQLIMLDINMPGMDGLEFCRYLRRDPQTAQVPIISMSSDTQPKLAEEAKAAGANAFLPKPIELEALETALQAPHLTKGLL